MPTSRMPFEPVTMDAHTQAIPGFHSGAGRNSRDRSRNDETQQFMSQEEQECIKFFENTINTLVEEDAVGETRQKQEQMSRRSTRRADELDGPRARTKASKDQDIIDLVYPPPPDVVQPRQQPFNTIMPDFTQDMVRNNPGIHYENKPRHEAMGHYPSEYNVRTPGEESAPYGHDQYQPIGSVPTPVLIAQKIAENQGGGGNKIVHRPSVKSNRSQRSETPPSSPGYPNKQGPPTSAKPPHYPSNINVMTGSNQHHSQTLAGVNLNDRKSQMLANLPGMPHSMEDEPVSGLQPVPLKLPTRSVSFRDPNPGKSRLEAISKLGLKQNSVHVTPDITNPAVRSTPAPVSALACTPTRTSSCKLDRPRQAKPSPLPYVQTYETRSHDNDLPTSPSPDVLSKDFNSYGGKTLVMNPKAAAPPASLPPTQSHGSKAQPTASSNFNHYGGKSTVMAQASVPTTQTDPHPPNVQSRAKPSPACTPVTVVPSKVESIPYGNNSYERKTKEGVTPDIVSHTLDRSPSRTQAPAPPAPSLAQKPFRYSTPNPNRGTASTPPEIQRKPSSKPSFRSQGITVQFSGRGATDESRREALRKLGLLKDTL
ncbi:hypothetical protein DPEC_G00107840 [Dallia pectoralis]|uniref:Uncharacterized protein n=1 Tax=Dallia pectoralis TaxID=75939 RepID=A0ACC2GSG9_DALPE|nr:hypothetical protein DPEC_G00107840 [Dallia pectoralis]